MRTSQLFGASILGLAAAMAATSSAIAAPSARLAAYRQDDQTSYALSLTADLAAKQVESVDVVVLFDTSATQQGAYRETAIEALKSLVGSLRPSDRLQVLTVDLDANALTEEFVAPGDAAVAQALAAISQQAPLGSTDLEKALGAAVERLEQAGSKNRAIVYIGDGVSMANMLDAPTLQPVVDKLRAARTPVSSYAVGPQVDAQTLAVFANHTGGNLYVAEPMVWQDENAGITDARAREENTRNAQGAGKELAVWTRAAVLWPGQAQLPDALGQVYPTSFPPLRADRDTILLGRTPAELDEPLGLQVVAEDASGQPVELAWTVTPEPANPEHAFLASMVDAAARDGGLTLPTVGLAGLVEAARVKGAEADQLTMLAQRAIATGDKAGALRIVEAVLRSDPGNVQAQTVQNALEGEPAELPAEGYAPDAVQAQATGEEVAGEAAAETPAARADGAIILNGPPAAEAPLPPPEPGLLERRGPSGAFLDEVEQEREVYERMMQA